jgi:hypothetical protein
MLLTSGYGMRRVPGFFGSPQGSRSDCYTIAMLSAVIARRVPKYCIVTLTAVSGGPRSQIRTLSSSALMSFASCVRILISFAGRQSKMKTLNCARSHGR